MVQQTQNATDSKLQQWKPRGITVPSPSAHRALSEAQLEFEIAADIDPGGEVL